MPTRYLSTVLRGLEGIYSFVSSQRGAPEEVELDLPLQLVSDVSRMAEYGTGLGLLNGWTNAAVNQVHTVTGDILTTINLAAPANALFGWPPTYDRDKFMPWLYGGWGSATEFADFVRAAILIRYQPELIGPAASP